LGAHFAENARDLVRLPDIGLRDEAVGAALADFRQRVVGRGQVLIVVDGDSDASSASLRAIPRPMPRELPVIRACF